MYPSGFDLEVRLRIGVSSGFRIKVLEVSSQELPWLHDDPACREIVEDRVRTVLAELFPPDAPADQPLAEHLRTRLQDKVAGFLEDYEIFVRPLLCVVAEEHEPGAFDALASIQAEWLIPVPFDHYVWDNCQRLEKLETTAARFFFSPSAGQRQVRVDWHSEFAFIVSEVRVLIDHQPVCTRACQQIIPAGNASVELPDLPVRRYRDLHRANHRVQVELLLGNGRTFPLGEFEAATADIADSPVGLFIDMGSTNSRLVEADLRGPEYARHHEDGSWTDALRLALDAAVRDERARARFVVEGPLPTTELAAAWNLPEYRKEYIDKGTDAEVAGKIAEVIRSFASTYCEKKRWALTEVIWSYPKTRQREFTRLSQLVSNAVEACLLGRVRVIPEHEALQWRFKHPLHHLAQVVKAAETAETDRQARIVQIDAWQKKWFFQKLFKRNERPRNWDTNPLPEPLPEDSYRTFRELSEDSELRNLLILDAGGFSLDVFGTIQGKASLEKSVDSAGGGLLTLKVREYLASNRGKEVGQIDVNDAEERKIEVCKDATLVSHDPLAASCYHWTREIYGAVIVEAVGWLQENLEAGKGVPLILTGGAVANRYLYDFICECMLAHGLKVVPTGSVEVFNLMNYLQVERPELIRFCVLTTGFRPGQLEASSDYDIVGGLCEYALASHAHG